jgi:transketolase
LIPSQNIHVYTHDSIGLGEDGPTHQPVEHVASLRLIPGLEVWRPCDTVESAVAWKCAIENTGRPTALIFTRQGLPHQARTDEQLANIARGAYVLQEPDGQADALIIATGSELGLAVKAAEKLSSGGTSVRVVSMPNPDLFLRQDESYRESVLPGRIQARVAVEAGVTSGWKVFVGDRGRVVGVDRFGASAPAGELFEQYGLTVENVSQAVRDSLAATE